jgi:alpha-L-fucosidase 2
MNYWLAGPANLIECYQPLFDLIEDISHTGQTTAKKHYGTVTFSFQKYFHLDSRR